MMSVSGAALIAQQPATPGGAPIQSVPPVALNPATNRLDAILLSWEQAMKPIQSAFVQCTHTVVDKVLKDTEVYEGTAQFMKPDLAIIDLKMKGRPQDVEHIICTGTFVYQFVPANQIIKVFDLKTGQSNQDNFLPFLQGMKAQDAKARYELTLVKEDKLYTYIKIVPRLLEDKADFARPAWSSGARRSCRVSCASSRPTATKISGTFPRSNPIRANSIAPLSQPRNCRPVGNGRRPRCCKLQCHATTCRPASSGRISSKRITKARKTKPRK